jgi:LacI family transcriptional regulator
VQPAEPRTTLTTVAGAAGVSLATVSTVVNDRHDVAPATRERVRRQAATALVVRASTAPPRSHR